MMNRWFAAGVLLVTLGAAEPSHARWAWEAGEVDERQLLDRHSEILVDAHEGYKRLAKGDAPRPFESAALAASVAALESLLNNSVTVGNEKHYAAIVTRIRQQLDDRIDRTEYELGRLLQSGSADDRARLRRLIDQDYFALPRLLRVGNLDRYRALEAKIRAQVGA
ncbi:MAG: hypothetical protein AAGA23_01075 [Pseudomonadota bacterium]